MSKKVENISSKLIEWAIARNGNSLDDPAMKKLKVRQWLEGTSVPTVSQLERFAKYVHVPFGYMFLEEPPEEPLTLPFFRTVGNSHAGKVSLPVFETIQIIQTRQEWLVEYMEQLGLDDLPFVGKYNRNSNPKDIVLDIRNVLNVAPAWATECENWEAALRFLIEKIEDAGIVVTTNGVVGNDTHRPINVEECRGFVLVDKKAPFLFVNAGDAPAARMFTLVHELAHVWLGASAGFDYQRMQPANDPVERLCDQVAAEFLVPESLFIKQWQITPNIVKLSRFFKVSRLVIARRAFDLNVINRRQFLDIYNDLINEYRQQRQSSSGGDFFATAKGRVSLRFAGFVNHAVRDGRLLYRDAYRLTNMKGKTYEKFFNQHR